MKIEYKDIREALKERDIFEFPELGIFISKGNIIKVAQWQPKGMLTFCEQNGFLSKLREHEEKCQKFLDYALKSRADIVVTPEYSTPWNLLQQCLDSKDKVPKSGKLWCLGMEGISCDHLEAFRNEYQDAEHICLIIEDLDALNQNAFFSCVAYLFRVGRELICVLQLKTAAAADAWAEFEAGGLTLGHVIYYFSDETKRNILFSFICADALNQDVIIGKNQILYQQCLILHPQLNPNPLHDSFNLMRKNFFDYSNVAVRMISSNWAKNTEVNWDDSNTIKIQKSFSAVYYNKELGNAEMSKLMCENKPQGIHLAKKDYIYVWYMNDNEHIIMYTLDSFNTNDLNNVTAKHKEPLAKEYLEYDSSSDNWMQKSGCDVCPIDWDWLKRDFNLEKCSSKECGVAGLHLFFSIMFCKPLYCELKFDKESPRSIFDRDSEELEEIVHLRERSKYIDEQIRNGNVPTKFHKLKEGNYQWILDEKGNLLYMKESEAGNSKEIICVAYVDVANESIIKRKIAEFEKLMGKEATDRLILYFFTGSKIDYYDKIYNKNINDPNLTHSVNTINKGEIMNIKELLKEYTVEEKNIMVQNKNYPFMLAVNRKQGKVIAQYYILDIVHKAEYDDCEESWADKNNFEEFETKLLEEDFFDSVGDSRFNLYLVMVVKNDSILLCDSYIRNDFKFARKVILKENQLRDYFGNRVMKREDTPYFSSKHDPKEIMLKLTELGDRASMVFQDEMKLQTYQFLQQKSAKSDAKFFATVNMYHLFRECMSYDNAISKATEKLPVDKYKISSIQEIEINDFKMMKNRRVIPFGHVNLLFGENGVGKTTLLDAIEFGITGMNRRNEVDRQNGAKVVVRCLNDIKTPISLSSENDYTGLAEEWYGIKAAHKTAFNKMFNQYNYFDTGFASAFAIEGQRQVNLIQLQEFLGIDKIEKGEKYLENLFIALGEIACENADILQKTHYAKRVVFGGRGKERYSADNSRQNAEKCQQGLKELKEEIEVISLSDILNAHIKKIESLFLLLIASSEYTQLRVEKGEIVAIRNSNGEAVSMAKMSTGQKVCLALAVMFDLFLSNSKVPNVIMLDEPAANLDDLHMLNLLDILRRLALSGTQIFFTTANPTVAQLCRRKFSFLENDFRYFTITDSDQKIEINYALYSSAAENPKKIVPILER